MDFIPRELDIFQDKPLKPLVEIEQEEELSLDSFATAEDYINHFGITDSEIIERVNNLKSN